MMFTIVLVHPRHGRLTLSRKSDPDLFELTIGGFGLTGIILTAKLRLAPLPSQTVVVKPIKVNSIEEAVTLMSTDANKSDSSSAM